MAIPVDSFFLDQSASGSLQARIRQMVAEGVLAGRFKSGERLPSSRALARQLGVSRITVTLAYTDLVADDYLTARGRSGYYVSETAPEPPAIAPIEAPDESSVDWSRVVAPRSEPLTQKPADWSSFRYPFIYGQTDRTLFDIAAWRHCAHRALGRADFESLTSDQYDRDDPELVSFLTRQTLPRRGIRAREDEVLITLGATNALWLTSQLLLTQRRRAAIEDPCYAPLRSLLTDARCHVDTVPVDAGGLCLDDLSPEADVVFCTPSHQCPTAATMPLARRQQLLDRAEAEDFLIVEDDYEFEMSFLAPPSPALKSLDRGGRVIYIGSFSKSLFPGLRLGYLVGPAPFIHEARRLRASVLRHPPGHLQRTTAYFLSLGHYDAMIGRMSRALHARRKVMDSAVAEHGLTVAGIGAFGGSAIWMRAPEGVDTRIVAAALAKQGVLIEPGASFFASSQAARNFYRLAYSSIPSERIAEGIAQIAAAMKTVDQRPSATLR